MTYDGVSRFFSRLPNKLNPFWVAKFAMERLGEQERWLRNRKTVELSRQIIAMRLANKRQSGEPIHVVFLCHMPSAWSTYDALVRRLLEDPVRFRVTLLASPYRHSTFGDDEYHDEGPDPEYLLFVIHILDHRSLYEVDGKGVEGIVETVKPCVSGCQVVPTV